MTDLTTEPPATEPPTAPERERELSGDLSDWVTTVEGAALTGYTHTHIRKLAEHGRLPARKVGRDWLVRRDALLAHKEQMDRLGNLKHAPWRDDLADAGRGRGRPSRVRRWRRSVSKCPVYADVWQGCPLVKEAGLDEREYAQAEREEVRDEHRA